MHLTKNILKHTAIYSFASILGKAIGFLMLPFYAHIFKTEGYGIIGILEASLGLLSTVLSPSITSAVVRFYHEEAEDSKRSVIPTTLVLLWGLIFTITPIIFFLGPNISKVLIGSHEYALFVFISFFSLALDVSGQTAGTFLVIQQRSVFFSTVGLIRLICGLTLNIWLIIILNMGLYGFFLSSIITSFISSFIFHFVAFKYCRFNFRPEIAKKIIRFQLPLIPSEFISYISRQAERIMVRFMVNLQAVGILEMGYKFPPLLGLLITEPFFRTWHTKRTEIAEQPKAPMYIGNMFTNYLYVMIFAGLMLSVNIQNILEVLTPIEFWQAHKIAKIEIITAIFIGAGRHMVFGLYYRKNTKKISFILSTTSIVKIILSFVMIKIFGILGAAYSACLMAAVRLGWYYRDSQNLYPIMLEFKKIVAMVVCALGIYFGVEYLDLSKFSFAVQAKNQLFPFIISILNQTPLGVWKSGKLIQLLSERQNQIFSLLINSIFCLQFLILLPFIRPIIFREAVTKLKSKILLKQNQQHL